MAHHHLLPFLALILLILPSSSQVLSLPTTPALFSDESGFLDSGHNLTNGVNTLSLKQDCGLYYYYDANGSLQVKNFNTPTSDSGCALTINNFGQLVIKYGDDTMEGTTLGKAGANGTYGLLFTEYELRVYGHRIWTKTKSSVNQITSTPKKLKSGTSNNFIFSDGPDIISGSANGNTTIAFNDNASALITSKCTLLVTISGETLWETEPTAKPTSCNLYLTARGVLSLLHKDSEGELHTQWTGGDLQQKNHYLAALRYHGGLDIYGLKANVRDIPPYAGSVAENIKMVTA